MTDPTTKEIVINWLRANGYDGLWNTDAECGCELADLMPCEEPGTECTAGVKIDEKRAGCDFLIGPRVKPASGAEGDVLQDADRNPVPVYRPSCGRCDVPTSFDHVTGEAFCRIKAEGTSGESTLVERDDDVCEEFSIRVTEPSAESAPVCGVCGGGGCGESYNRRLEMRDATESDRIKAELGDVKKILDAHGDDYILVVQHSTADGIKEITYSHQGDPPDTDKTSNGDELQKIRQELSEIRKEMETEKQERGEECQKLHGRIAAHVAHLRPHNDDALQKVRQEVSELRSRRR